MKNILKLTGIAILILPFLFISSCNKYKIPEVTTLATSGISQTKALTGGLINNIEHTSIAVCGVCWSTDSLPMIDDNKTEDKTVSGRFESRLTGLIPGTTYHLRAYATDTLGHIRYGNELIFRTSEWVEVTDIDGNNYNAITIDSQTWMTENLKTTRLRDGTVIRLVTDSTAWSKLSGPAYCWYKNDQATYKGVYGALYNWFTANTGRLCPAGWHVPSDAEWTVLTTYLGGEQVAGGKLKRAGKSFWVAPNSGATNEAGFNALPGGFRLHTGRYLDFGFSSYWWSATELNQDRAYFRFLYYLDSTAYRFENQKTLGFSIRCVKD